MALKRRKLLAQDVDFGFGTSVRPADAGGYLVGDKIGMHQLLGDAYLSAASFSGNLSERANEAARELPSTGGIIDATGLQGPLSITSPIGTDKPITLLVGDSSLSLTTPLFEYSGAGTARLIGAGIDKTSFLLSGSGCINFNPSYGTHGLGLRDLKITSTSTTQDAVVIGNASAATAFFDMRNVKITGPSGSGGGTAHGVNIQGMYVSHIKDVWVYKCPGDGWHINGDNGGESRFTHISADSCGGWGWYLGRENTSDQGGWQIDGYSIFSDIDNVATMQGIAAVGPNGSQAETFLHITSSGVDKALGGDAILVKNIGHFRIVDCEVIASAAVGNNAAVHIYNVNDGAIIGNKLNSRSRIVWLENTVNAINIAHNTFFGYGTATGYYVQAGAALGYIDITGQTTIAGGSGLASITNNAAALAASRSTLLNNFPDAFGWAVSGDLKVSDDVGVLDPDKYIRSESGVLRFYADDETTNTLQLGDDGALAPAAKLNQLSADKFATTATITSGNSQVIVSFASAYGSTPVVSVTPRADPGSRVYVTGNAAQVVIHTTSAVPTDVAFDVIIVGNPF